MKRKIILQATSFVTMSIIVLLCGCSASRYYYYSYEIVPTQEEDKHDCLGSILSAVEAAGAQIDKNPHIYASVEDDYWDYLESCDITNDPQLEQIKTDKEYQGRRVQEISQRFRGSRNDAKFVGIKVTDDKIEIVVSGQTRSLRADDTFFLTKLEKELEQRNINYKFGYDWRLGSVFDGGELPVLIESQKGN